ncbi:MAG: AAA family ATPase [Pseudomonadales bacterium]|nr:AAA family ATPase [Pseudomonadales bacterium]
MYLQHFGLAQYPFSLTPNTRYFLKLPSHQQAFDALVAVLSEEGNFSKIIGEVGTGKTMLCRKVLNALGLYPDKYLTAYIPHPILSEEATMLAIAEELRLEVPAQASYRDLLKLITECILRNAEQNRQVVLFIDEAQAMPEESLKAIHLLTQALPANAHPMQVILFGQPELDEVLERPMLKQLNSAVSYSYVLPALDNEGVEAYVQHRLSKAGYSGNHMFTAGALDNLLKNSRGIPRLINILCHKSLMVAFGKGERTIDEKHMQAAIDDTEPAQRTPSWTERLFGA